MASLTKVEIRIPMLPPSPNRTRRNTHWSARAAIDKQWLNFGWAGSLEACGANPPRWPSVHVTITFYFPDKRRRDPGNLMGSEGVKGLIDGLVMAGVMVDDSMDVIKRLDLDFIYRKGQPGTHVLVEPVE